MKKALSAHNPIIRLYHQLYQFQQDQPKHQEFSKAIDQLQTHLPPLGEKEKSFLLGCWINTAISYYNKGNQVFLSLIVRLYKLVDLEDQMLYRNKMQAASFLNVVLFCSGLGEFDWTKQFMERYQPFLSEDEKESTLNLAWGYWYYLRSRKDKQKNDLLQQAHAHLSKVPYTDLSVDLRLRSLQLRVYFDLELLSGNESVFLHFCRCFRKVATTQDRSCSK